jgi:hypothetical protein
VLAASLNTAEGTGCARVHGEGAISRSRVNTCMQTHVDGCLPLTSHTSGVLPAGFGLWTSGDQPIRTNGVAGSLSPPPNQSCKIQGKLAKTKRYQCLCDLICIHQLNYSNIDYDPELSACCTYRTECKTNSPLTFVRLFLFV